MPFTRLICGIFMALAIAQSGARAETLRVSGVTAPRANIAGDMELIVMERLRGDLGSDAEFALRDALARVSIAGEPWFEILTPEALNNAVVEIESEDGSTYDQPLAADATFRGSVRSEVLERDIEPRFETECVERAADNSCTKESEVRIECAELTVRIRPRLALINGTGQQIYTYGRANLRQERYCADDIDVPSVLDMSDGLIDQMASDMRRDLAPFEYTRWVRVMERRRGLKGDDRDAFRDAVRLTKQNARAACDAFRALEASNPQHLSVLFNIGLCHESSQEIDLATDYYQRALAIDPDHDYPRRGLSRVRRYQSGLAFLAEREAN